MQTSYVNACVTHQRISPAGGLLPADEGEGRGAGAALGVGEGAAAPVRRILQEVGELPLLLGQHAMGPPRRRSVSLLYSI